MTKKGGRHSSGVTTLRTVNTRNKQLGLSIPTTFYDQLSHLLGKPFLCELTPEGILFRPVEVSPTDVPAWAKGDA